MSDEQVESLKSFEKSIIVLGKIPKDSLDIRKLTNCYYILPDAKVSTKAWGILEQALESSKSLVVVKFGLKSKPRLGVLNTIDGVIVLHNVSFEENFVTMNEKIKTDFTEEEAEMGKTFVESLKKIDLSGITDEYNTKLQEILEGKELIAIEVKPAKDETALFKA